MTQLQHIKDITNSSNLTLYPVTKGFDYLGDETVANGTIALGSFLKQLGLACDYSCFMVTDTGNIYLVRDQGNNVVDIEYIDTDKWSPAVHDPEADVEVYSPDFISELIHFKMVSFKISFGNNKLFWWGVHIDENESVAEFEYETIEVTEMHGSAKDNFDEVLFHDFSIVARDELTLTISVSNEQSIFNYIDVTPEVKELLLNEIEDGKDEMDDPNINSIQFGERIWLIYDAKSERFAIDAT